MTVSTVRRQHEYDISRYVLKLIDQHVAYPSPSCRTAIWCADTKRISDQAMRQTQTKLGQWAHTLTVAFALCPLLPLCYGASGIMPWRPEARQPMPR